MDHEPHLWVRALLRIGAFTASEAELGDVVEEYGSGNRSVLWVTGQILSTVRRRRSLAATSGRRASMLSNLWRDVVYAARTLRRNPGFAFAAIAPIALGIGVNTGIFSILDSAAFRPLPVRRPTDLVSVHQEFRGVQHRRVHGARSMFSIPEYRAYRDGTRTLSGVMAYSRPWTVTLGGQSPQEIEGAMVTCNYFDVLQVRPSMGPGFTASNCESPGAPPVVVLSHTLWTRAFGADPGIVGATLSLNGQAVGVVGVAPKGFDGVDLTRVTFFAPTRMEAVVQPERGFHEDPQTSWLTLIGRRREGAGIADVRADLALIAGQIDQQQPGRTTVLNVAPATSLSLPVARGEVLSLAAVVLGAFGLVLLIACANVANVLLARATRRAQEIAVRLSVGATRGRLVQQLLTESMMIAVAGGLLGSLLAWWSFHGLLAWTLSSLPGTLPPLRIDAQPSLNVLWFALGMSLGTALLFGMIPALQASKQELQAALKQQGGRPRRGASGWLRDALIGVQVAVCMVLLVSAGLLLRALHAAETVEPGFDYRNVAVVAYDLRGPTYDDQTVVAFQQRVLERMRSLPGVDAVALASKAPLSPGRRQTSFRLPGQEQRYEVDVNTVSPEYFSLIAIPIVRGRTFTTSEREDTSPAIIVTEATARRYWPGQDPIGRTVLMEGQETAAEVVGVARDAQVSYVGETASSYMYLPAGPGPERRLGLLVRSHADFATFATGVRAMTRELDPGLVARVARLEGNLDFWRAVSRLVAGLSGSLSVLALVLASIGVYGVVSYAVSSRRREVGIRMALGASASDVLGLILRQTLRPVGAGALIGIGGAAASSQILQSVLFGVSRLDPIAFLGALVFLLAVAAVASLVPTREALRIDPVTILRCE
jgi:predicted permease